MVSAFFSTNPSRCKEQMKMRHVSLLLSQICRIHLYIFLYSDNCMGQNKNKVVLAVTHTETNSITYKCLTVGHTQNEDSMHSVIEKAKKRVLKVAVWCSIPVIDSNKNTKKDGKPYKVIEMDRVGCLDFKNSPKTVITKM